MKKRNTLFLYQIASVMTILLFLCELACSQDICDFFRAFRNNPKSSVLKRMNAERVLGEVCRPKDQDFCEKQDILVTELYKIGFSEKDQTLNDLLKYSMPYDSPLWVSKVDIDNDGNEEIRLFKTEGSASCTYSYFYRREESGQLRLIVNRGYDDLSESARFCDGGLLFIRYQGKVYVLEVYNSIDTVWLGTKTELKQICKYDEP